MGQTVYYKPEIPKEYVSLFEYLGYPGGRVLGKQLYNFAKRTRSPIMQKDVKIKTYDGKVMVYPKETITQFFISEIIFNLPETIKRLFKKDSYGQNTFIL